MKKNFVRNILLVMVVVMAMFAITGCANQPEPQPAHETLVNKYEGWEVIGIDIEVSHTSGSGTRNDFVAAAIDTNGEFHAVKVNRIVIIEDGNPYLVYQILENGLRGTKLFVTKDDYKALS